MTDYKLQNLEERIKALEAKDYMYQNSLEKVRDDLENLEQAVKRLPYAFQDVIYEHKGKDK